MTSRLIVKNIPKNIDELKLKNIFSKFGDVTDVKIIFNKNKENRRICFIGYKNPKSGKEAQEYFNNTYIQASKISVDFAKLKDENNQQPEIRVNRQNTEKKVKTEQGDQKDQDKKITNQDKFKEFLQLMKSGSTQNMSWNDVLYQKQENQKISKKKQQKQMQKDQEKITTNLEQLEKELEEKRQGKKLKKNKKKSSDQIEVEKEEKKEDEKEDKEENEEEKKPVAPIDSKRLYVVNLPYVITEDEVRELFSKYGNVIELKLPKQQDGITTRGFCFVSYEMEEEALRCFSELDNSVVFGRIMHIRPSYEQPLEEKQRLEEKKLREQKIEEENREKSSYKKMKKVEMRKKLEDQTNWNTLFLNPNSILESISSQYNVKKSDILSADAEDLAVRTAHAETQVIKETKEWMLGQGMNLSFLDEDRQSCKRSETIMLVKNLPYSITVEKVKDIFGHFGQTDKVLISPNKALGLVEFINKEDAENAFKQLSYHIIKHNPLYLEWAPFDIIELEKQQEKQNKNNQNQQNENKQDEQDETTKLSHVLYVKNLNFETKDNELLQHFESYNVGDIRSAKIVRKKDGLSCGYAFVEFDSEQGVLNSLKKVQRTKLHKHMLQLSVSSQKKKVEPTKQKKQKQQYDVNTKIVVRNLAFEATKKDIRSLFKHYGELKVVRLPQKINGQHRGFAFVEFVSSEEAKNAVQSLSNTHLYGRKLVIEYAKQDFDTNE